MKIKFFFEDNASFTVTDATSFNTLKDVFEYVVEKNKDGIEVCTVVKVPMHDVLYIVVEENGTMLTIPGKYSSFSVVPAPHQVLRQKNIEADAARIAEGRAKAAEKAKQENKEYHERCRAERKAIYKHLPLYKM